MARRSTRKRPEATPEPAPAPAPAAASAEPKSATKKRRASPATKADPKKRKLNPDTPDDLEDKPKKPTQTAVKKKPASKRDSAGKRTKTKFSEETKDSAKAQPNVSKEDSNSKVTKAKKARCSDDEKRTKTETNPPKENSKVKKIKAKVSDGRNVAKKTTKDAEDTKKAFRGPKKSDKSEKTSSHESEAESDNRSKAAGSTATREDSFVTTSIPESGISEMAFSVAEADDDGQTGDDENPDSTADGGGHDDIGTQRVSPLPSDLDGGATELETDIELSMHRMNSGEQHGARDPGDTPYQDHTLHPNTMLFLKDLKENNSRDWLKEYCFDYQQAKNDWESFIENLTKKIIEKDKTIPEQTTRDIIVRIQKDNRSSKDQTCPYKTYFSAVWSRSGKDGNHASYYIRLEPGSCYVGSGFSCTGFSPQDKLALLRADIDKNPGRLKAILREPNMRREFLEGAPDKEEEVVKAFVELPENKENAMKSQPKVCLYCPLYYCWL